MDAQNHKPQFYFQLLKKHIINWETICKTTCDEIRTGVFFLINKWFPNGRTETEVYIFRRTEYEIATICKLVQ
jgi:hypothetical protein